MRTAQNLVRLARTVLKHITAILANISFVVYSITLLLNHNVPRKMVS